MFAGHKKMGIGGDFSILLTFSREIPSLSENLSNLNPQEFLPFNPRVPTLEKTHTTNHPVPLGLGPRASSGRLVQADIWSLGCVFLEMATAEKPWGNGAFENVPWVENLGIRTLR